MKTIYLSLITLLLSTVSFAQSETVNGKITDDNGHALERAWVLVLDADDYTYVTGTITDEYGNFEIKDIEDGNYILSVDHISFEEPKKIGILNTEEYLNGQDNMHLKQIGTELILETVQTNHVMHYNFDLSQK